MTNEKQMLRDVLIVRPYTRIAKKRNVLWAKQHLYEEELLECIWDLIKPKYVELLLLKEDIGPAMVVEESNTMFSIRLRRNVSFVIRVEQFRDDAQLVARAWNRTLANMYPGSHWGDYGAEAAQAASG